MCKTTKVDNNWQVIYSQGSRTEGKPLDEDRNWAEVHREIVQGGVPVAGGE
jgi:hypothetical protein